ncbi:hypothetical protein V6M85_08085 [Sulfolobus tengchongensis]|uniref:DUF3800 domain-containing protein n=1 Tax=Sulfolobus tengchongensis TaxID=207809 RepID=A0AAX4KZ65_9CREN
MNISVDESGNQSVKDPYPFVIGIAIIKDTRRYEQGYKELLNELNLKKVFKYSNDSPKKDKPYDKNIKDQFINFLSSNIISVSVIIEKFEDIKNLAVNVYGKVVAHYIGKYVAENIAYSDSISVYYDRNPLLKASDKQYIMNNFHNWLRIAKVLKPRVTVYLEGKDRDIWISASDYVASLTRDYEICSENGFNPQKYCELVNEWIDKLSPCINFLTTIEIKNI